MRGSGVTTPRGPFLALALLGVTLAVYGSLVPLDFADLSPEEVSDRLAGVLEPEFHASSRIDLAVNFLLFVPIAFFGLGFLTRGRTDARSVIGPALLLCVGCLSLSLVIEVAQVWFPPRVPSALDVMAQMAGTLIGIVLWTILGAGTSAWMRAGAGALRPRQRGEWFLQGWAVVLFLYSLLPLDLTLSPADLHEKFKNGHVRLIPFTWEYGTIWRAAWELGLDAALMVPIGMLARLGRIGSRSRGTAFTIGLAYVLLVEFCQVFVASRISDVTDILSGGVGVALGVAWADRLRSSPAQGTRRVATQSRWQPWVAGCAYTLLLLLIFWAPFDFRFDGDFVRPGLGDFFRTPLANAQESGAFLAVSALLRKFLLFAPLGACAAWAVSAFQPAPRRVALFVLFLLIGALAVGIELGQVLLPDRTGSFGDAMVMLIGALAGAVGFAFLMAKRRSRR